ncbi:hypothetical protein ACLGI4_12650 [Streptomyces sp. HMX112]|uniref:hypothetical protein n=1 Tax=Streptomyces sp. HMX112 TaxID=3390850 RepID=UPI003A7FF376
MNLKSQAGIGIFATFLASAAMASSASAMEAPVELPLRALGTVLPMEPPTVRTGVPLPMPGTPVVEAPASGRVQEASLPQVPFTTGFPETRVAAPLPDLLGGRPLGQALLTAPSSDLAAVTPGASLGAPITLPRAEAQGVPGVVPLEVAVLAPKASGGMESHLGLDEPEK